MAGEQTQARHVEESRRGTAAEPAERPPANRLGLDYRAAAQRKVTTPVVDVHLHVRTLADAPLFFEAAEHYQVWHCVSMTPLEHVAALRDAYPDRLSFIAIPTRREGMSPSEFQAQWLHELAEFRQFGAALCKFWMAPPMREKYGLTLEHEFFAPIIDRALELGYAFMVHIADPTLWFRPGGRYADPATFGTKAQQYDQLEYFLDKVAPRPVIGAHLGGNIEDPAFMRRLLATYPHYHLDTSATKWIVREVAPRVAAVRDLITAYPDRILFGSDLVTGEKYDFDHYASRYWTHLQLWESDYDGESPIVDPDVTESAPRLRGLDLPPDVLEQIYLRNAERLGLVGAGRLG